MGAETDHSVLLHAASKEAGDSVSSRQTKSHPTSAFFFPTRFLAYDHRSKAVDVVSLHPPDAASREIAKNWQLQISALLQEKEKRLIPTNPISRPSGGISFRLVRDQSVYTGTVAIGLISRTLDDIQRCLREIDNGESYELCLTNKIETTFTTLTENSENQASTLDLYLALRSRNPAPYSAFLRFPSYAVLSSSPEKFITIDREGKITSKPIKGTLPRGTSLLLHFSLRKAKRRRKTKCCTTN